MANVNLIDSSNIKVTQNSNNISLDFGSETVVDSIRTKNMFDSSYTNNKWVSYPSGSMVDAANANARRISCSSGDTFTLSATFGSNDSNNIIVMAFYNASGTLLNRYVASNSTTLTLTETAPSNTSYMYVGHYSNLPNTIQLEKGSTATTYAPYQNLTGQENYSTTETIIGTWIDGKTLYRKVVSDTVSTTNGAWKDFNPFSSNEIDTVVSLVGTFTYASGATVSIPYTRTTSSNYSDREYILANVHKYNGTLSVIAYHPTNYSGLMSGQKFRITVEYTKN